MFEVYDTEMLETISKEAVDKFLADYPDNTLESSTSLLKVPFGQDFEFEDTHLEISIVAWVPGGIMKTFTVIRNL